MIEKHLKEIGQRLKDLRKMFKLTQKNMADAAGISDGALSEFESGNKRPSSKLLFYLASVHSVNINYVLTGKGNIFYEGIDFSLFEHKEKIKDMLRLMIEKKSVYYSVLAVYSKLLEDSLDLQ